MTLIQRMQNSRNALGAMFMLPAALLLLPVFRHQPLASTTTTAMATAKSSPPKRSSAAP